MILMMLPFEWDLQNNILTSHNATTKDSVHFFQYLLKKNQDNSMSIQDGPILLFRKEGAQLMSNEGLNVHHLNVEGSLLADCRSKMEEEREEISAQSGLPSLVVSVDRPSHESSRDLINKGNLPLPTKWEAKPVGTSGGASSAASSKSPEDPPYKSLPTDDNAILEELEMALKSHPFFTARAGEQIKGALALSKDPCEYARGALDMLSLIDMRNSRTMLEQLGPLVGEVTSSVKHHVTLLENAGKTLRSFSACLIDEQKKYRATTSELAALTTKYDEVLIHLQGVVEMVGKKEEAEATDPNKLIPDDTLSSDSGQSHSRPAGTRRDLSSIDWITTQFERIMGPNNARRFASCALTQHLDLTDWITGPASMIEPKVRATADRIVRDFGKRA